MSLVLITALLFLLSSLALAAPLQHRGINTNGNTTNVPSYAMQKRDLLLSYAAFCEPGSGLVNWACFWCDKLKDDARVEVFHIIENDDSNEGIYGYVGIVTPITPIKRSGVRSEDPFVVLSFRGSDTLDNWIRDFEFWREPFPDVPGAAVHHGFWSAWVAVRGQVVSAVEKAVSEVRRRLGRDVVVLNTGHSLGAALSALSAVELERRALSGVASVQMVNFGQPRVGNFGFANYTAHLLQQNHFRVVNHRDIVPHLPMLDVGYFHAPRELWYENSYTQWKTCSPTNGEDPSCSDQDDEFDPKDHDFYLDIDLHDGFGHDCGHPKN
jgi:Lipase (class 3)